MLQPTAELYAAHATNRFVWRLGGLPETHRPLHLCVSARMAEGYKVTSMIIPALLVGCDTPSSRSPQNSDEFKFGRARHLGTRLW